MELLQAHTRILFIFISGFQNSLLSKPLVHSNKAVAGKAATADMKLRELWVFADKVIVVFRGDPK